MKMRRGIIKTVGGDQAVLAGKFITGNAFKRINISIIYFDVLENCLMKSRKPNIKEKKDKKISRMKINQTVRRPPKVLKKVFSYISCIQCSEYIKILIIQQLKITQL